MAVQSLSHVWLIVTPRSAAHQASLSFTISLSLLNLMSIELVMPSNHLLLHCPLFLLPCYPMSHQLFASGGQSIEASASASVLPMNIQGCFPLGLTSLISLQTKGLSRVYSTTVIQKHQFFSTQPSLTSRQHIFFSTGQVLLFALSWCSACTLCLKVYSWYIRVERCTPHPPTPPPSCSSLKAIFYSIWNIFVVIWYNARI